MPIIAVILISLVAWTIYWFVRMGGLDHIQAKRAQREDAERSAKAREAARNAPLRAIDDPRDAAMILMLLIARESGDPTREQIAAIEKMSRETFGFGEDLAARMTQANFIASRAESFAQAAGVFGDLFNKRLTADEKRELFEMVREVADFEGGSQAHEDALGVLARRVGLVPAI
jgi:hypothetical protein